MRFTVLPFATRFDRHVSPDVRLVTETAEVLQIREFEVFEHAHRLWSGRQAEPQLLDGMFGGYLTQQRVPAWVRHYGRAVLEAAAADRLEPQRFGVERPTMLRMTRGENIHAALAVAVGLLVYLFFLI